MASRKLYAVVGIVCGFVLIDYGFNFLAIGLPEAGALTSQFVGGTLAAGGSVVVFLALYSLLSPAAVVSSSVQVPDGPAPDVSVETIVEEETGSQYGFYKHIEYVGYFFTALGLFSLADLILQVFIHQLYNETRWWIEVLLLTFGILSYAIFGSIGRIGAQEEREMASHIQPVHSTAPPASESSVASSNLTEIPSMIDAHLADFVKSPSGDLEHHLVGRVYDMMRIHPEMVTIWREDRQEMRAVYLIGPYEFTRELLEKQLKRGEELRVGSVSLTLEVIQELLKPKPETVSA